MPKTKSAASLHLPLGGALGTQAKVAVIRILERATSPLPHREVVRRSGMAYRSISLALTDLLAMGLVEEQAGGRERRISLHPGHRLAPAIAALFRAEADFYPSLRTELRAIAANGEKEGLLAVVIVGSVAQQKERLGEPLELVVVTSAGDAALRWRKRYQSSHAALTDRFGVTVRLNCYDLAEARKLWSTRTAKTEFMVRDSEVVWGAALLALVETV